MAEPPPSYSDLGKDARDLFTKDYNYGFYKLGVKTETASGVEFHTNVSSNHDSGKFLGTVETKYKWTDYGLRLGEKWNTDSNLSTEMSIEDQLVNGLKLSFEALFAPQTGKKCGKIKTDYKRDYFRSNVDVDFDVAGPVIHGAWVLGYSGWLAGYQTAFDTAKSKVTRNNFALGYCRDDISVHTAVNDGNEFSGSLFQKVTEHFQVGAQLSWSGANSMRFGIGVRVCLHPPDAVFRARVHNNAQIGLSYHQRLQDGIWLTLSTLIEGKTFNQGGHKIGLGLELEA